MAHFSATVTFDDGAVWYGEYNGTVDVMLTRIFQSDIERDDNWRNRDHATCSCGHAEPCWLRIFGDDGWRAKACRKCGVFCGPLAPPMED